MIGRRPLTRGTLSKDRGLVLVQVSAKQVNLQTPLRLVHLNDVITLHGEDSSRDVVRPSFNLAMFS